MGVGLRWAFISKFKNLRGCLFEVGVYMRLGVYYFHQVLTAHAIFYKRSPKIIGDS